jgi:hypothetical protein
MDDINPELSGRIVALVVGANDVTNPAARKPGSPVSGMPILDVDHAKSIIVIKRSMGRGYVASTTVLREPEDRDVSPTRRKARPAHGGSQGAAQGVDDTRGCSPDRLEVVRPSCSSVSWSRSSSSCSSASRWS